MKGYDWSPVYITEVFMIGVLKAIGGTIYITMRHLGRGRIRGLDTSGHKQLNKKLKYRLVPAGNQNRKPV